MSSVVISGDTSGAVTLAAPAVAGTNTLTLLAATATMSVNTLATAVASTSGTSIDFTGLPAWVKRITVMFSGVSGSGTSSLLVQLGTGSTTYTTSGYAAIGAFTDTAAGVVTSTAGFPIFQNSGTNVFSGMMTITNITSNTWVANHTGANTTGGFVNNGGGNVPLGAVLTAVRITRVNGTDTFDAGTINILYEG